MLEDTEERDFVFDAHSHIETENILDIIALTWSPDQTYVAASVEEATWTSDGFRIYDYVFFDQTIILHELETGETTVIDHPVLSFGDISWIGNEKIVTICAIIEDNFYRFIDVCEIDIASQSVKEFGFSFGGFFPPGQIPSNITAREDGTIALSRSYGGDGPDRDGDLYVYPPGETEPINIYEGGIGLVYSPHWYYLPNSAEE